MFKFKKEKVQWNQLLGKGAFSEVYPYQKNKDDQRWVVKVIHASDDQHLIYIIDQIVVGFSCDHPNIVPVKGYFIERLKGPKYNVYLKLPRMMETLKEKIEHISKSFAYYSEDQIINYLYSLVCGLDYLHQKKIAHGYITPTNLMFSQDGSLKLCDVGAALGQSHNRKKKEVFKDDAWSLGLVMTEFCLKQKEIYNTREPNLERREKQLQDKISELKGKYSEQLIRLLFDLLSFHPQKRRSIADTKRYLEENYSQLSEHFQQRNPKDERFVKEVKTRKGEELEETKKDVESVKVIEKIPIIQDDRILQMQNDIEKQFEGTVSFTESGQCTLLQKLEEHDFQRVLKSIHHLNLKELVIKGHADISDDGYKTLIDFIGSDLKALQHLSLCLVSNATESTISILTEHIGTKMQSLKHLSLSIIFNQNITDLGVNSLAQNIGNLRSLQHLDLNFGFSATITDNGLKAVAENIGNQLNSLLYFSLNFQGNPNITDTGFEVFAQQIISNLKSLQHLNLNFSHCTKDINDNCLVILAQNIGNNCKSLRHLILHFHSAEIGDPGFKALAEHLGRNLKYLQHLDLDLNCNTNITDDGLNYFAQSLESLKPLHHLALSLNSVRNFTDSGLTSLAKSLRNHFMSLQHLTLNFESSTQITGNGFMILVENIGNSLKSLSLDFGWDYNITDAEVKMLAQKIGKNLHTLENLKINLEHTPEITDDGFKSLVKNIGNNLKSLNLDFHGTKGITDTSIIILNAHLRNNLKFLQDLQLSFQSNPYITKEKAESLAKSLCQSPNSIQKFSLDTDKLQIPDLDSLRENFSQRNLNLGGATTDGQI